MAGSNLMRNRSRISRATPGWFDSACFLHPLRRVQARLLAVAGQRADQGRVAPGDRRAPCTRRLKPSFSVRPVQTATTASSNASLTSANTRSRAARVLDLEVVHPDRRRGPPASTGKPASAMAFRPMFSRIGSTSASGAGASWR